MLIRTSKNKPPLRYRERARFAQPPEEEEEQLAKEPSAQDAAKAVVQALQANAEILANVLVIGIALVFIRAGLPEKKDLAAFKPATITNQFRPVVQAILGNRNAVKQELRLLWRLGANKYVLRKAQELRQLA